MNSSARIYRADILRAVLGAKASEEQVADIERLNRIAERLAESEEAQTILRAKGHGGAGMSIVDVARSVPENVRGMLANLFSRPARRPDLDEVHDLWSAR